ncbi:hypothetical protein K4F52_002307 [Lecanicillium sp. MT-2017a]|nr:hypothetical protein K4F52_002307 [Lecanicillium sp. MT-2017a]
MPSAVTNGATEPVVADFIIVGAGFGGCYALHELRLQGYSAKIIEAGGDFGGVWHFNRYPGARVDSETPAYQLSLAAASDGFDFTQRFPSDKELRSYFSHIAKSLDLRKDAIFNHRIIEAKYDDQSKTWNFKSDKGLEAKSRYAIFAAGTTNKAYIPDYPNLKSFKGPVIHPCAWPEDINLKGKKVGIIGQGSSGVQILQELASTTDCDLTVFVRTPPTCFPMVQRDISVQESESVKGLYESLFHHAKYRSKTGYPHNGNSQSFSEETPEQRERAWERLWARGGFSFLASNYIDTTIDKTANAAAYQFWAKKIRERITDPVKRDIFAPLEQKQWISTKRPILESQYYEMIDKPSVKVVDLKKSAIKEFTADGIITECDGENTMHNLDVVIVATGYDSVTGSLFDMNIRDKNGSTLQEKWKDGISTHLGMMVSGMPNAYFLYGPQAPTSLANGPPFIELQVEFVSKMVEMAKKKDIDAVEVSEEAAQTWRAKTLAIFEMLLHRETDSWWVGTNVPGKKREPLIWFGGLPSWWDACMDTVKNWDSYSRA